MAAILFPLMGNDNLGQANRSRRAAECKRDPFRQHDLGSGTRRFKSSRPDQKDHLLGSPRLPASPGRELVVPPTDKQEILNGYARVVSVAKHAHHFIPRFHLAQFVGYHRGRELAVFDKRWGTFRRRAVKQTAVS